MNTRYLTAIIFTLMMLFVSSSPALEHESQAMSSNSSPLPVTTINHATLNASDPVRSMKWFQGLFGLPIVARQGDTVVMRVGDGPQFLAINGTASKTPDYSHYGLTIDYFNAEQFAGILREHGLTQSHTPGPMQFSIRNRGGERGGAPEGTTEVFFGDPDGIVVQVQDSTYCGGAGLLGDLCYKTPEPAPSKGLLRIRKINHITNLVSNGPRSTAFYQKIFKLPIDTYQGETPVLRVGSGNDGVVLFDMSKMKGIQPGVDHTCFVVDDFDIEASLTQRCGLVGFKPYSSFHIQRL